MLKALETKYNGITFRSRMEARWAVFMDEMEIKYIYEPEGFELEPGLFYLPDFWLPQFKSYLEIKPVYPTKDEEYKASVLAEKSGHNVYVFCGNPSLPDFGLGSEVGRYIYPARGGWDDNQRWCHCPTCGLVGLEYEGRLYRTDCKCPYLGGHNNYRGHDTAKLKYAYERATVHRFLIPADAR